MWWRLLLDCSAWHGFLLHPQPVLDVARPQGFAQAVQRMTNINLYSDSIQHSGAGIQ
jgi:hypothetical protein